MYTRQEIEILKQKIAELEKELEKGQDKKYPDEGTRYYYIDSCRSVDSTTWGSEMFDIYLWEHGLAFLDEEKAEEYAEVLKTEDELYMLADDDREWDGFNPHYAISYYCVNRKISYPVTYNYEENSPYFESAESAKNAVETVGEDRVIKWLTYKRKRPQI